MHSDCLRSANGEHLGPVPTAEKSGTQNEGWGWTQASHWRHYFRNGRTLCGRFGLRTEEVLRIDTRTTGVDDCWKCRMRKMAERGEFAALIPCVGAPLGSADNREKGAFAR